MIIRFDIQTLQKLSLVMILLASGCASERSFWLENMVVHHGYTDAEIASVLRMDSDEVPALLRAHGIRRGTPVESGKKLKVLPYPGGRHPRIGFLDGAIDPHRGTKVSIFTPWDPHSYVVVDLPEALWWKTGKEREPLYLAHTHIPTHWDKRDVHLPRHEWNRRSDGSLDFSRRLPNGVEFGARVIPRNDRVDMELRMHNGSDNTIAGLDTQVCVLLKRARGFNAPTLYNRKAIGENIAVRSESWRRCIVTRWDGGELGGSVRCPCIHSNPKFPDLAPGQHAVVRGELYFYEGSDISSEVARRKRSEREPTTSR